MDKRGEMNNKMTGTKGISFMNERNLYKTSNVVEAFRRKRGKNRQIRQTIYAGNVFE